MQARDRGGGDLGAGGGPAPYCTGSAPAAPLRKNLDPPRRRSAVGAALPSGPPLLLRLSLMPVGECACFILAVAGASITSRRRCVGIACLTLAITVVVAAIVFVLRELDLEEMGRVAEAWRRDNSRNAILIAFGLYVVWIVAFLPTTMPELVLGFVFGFELGYAINVAGKLVGATLSYALGRTLLRSCLHAALGKSDMLLAVEEEIHEKPYWTSLLLRAAYVPFSMKNYGLAIMRLPSLPFFTVLLLVEFPDSYILTATGATAKDLADLLSPEHEADAAADRKARRELAVLGVQLVVLGLLIHHVASLASRAIERRRARKLEGREGDGASHARLPMLV